MPVLAGWLDGSAGAATVRRCVGHAAGGQNTALVPHVLGVVSWNPRKLIITAMPLWVAAKDLPMLFTERCIVVVGIRIKLKSLRLRPLIITGDPSMASAIQG